MYSRKGNNQNFRRMLRILKSGTTSLVVTVTELTTLSNPEYLFEFVEEQTDTNLYCILADVSTATTRFNEFSITDGVDVTFTVEGFYTYNIYEQANGSGNLDPDGLTLVETGRAHIYVVDASRIEYISTETNTAYNG